ncbi:hypothetical protein HN011_004549 [Eciton burchellii]|nr:hypothetical protein HN011_004549 [Eciton burchellii]
MAVTSLSGAGFGISMGGKPRENFVHLWRTGDTTGGPVIKGPKPNTHAACSRALSRPIDRQCVRRRSLYGVLSMPCRCAGCAFNRRFFDKFEIDVLAAA